MATKTFDIMYDDLTPKAQEALCKLFNATPEEENWEYFPVAVVEREDEEGNKTEGGN